MSMGPGAFLPQKYSKGDKREWDGTSGAGYCEISLSGGGETPEYFSDDDLLEVVLWMIGRCYSPGNPDRVSEAMMITGSNMDWRLQFNMRMATDLEIQSARNRSSQFARSNREAVAEQR